MAIPILTIQEPRGLAGKGWTSEAVQPLIFA